MRWSTTPTIMAAGRRLLLQALKKSFANGIPVPEEMFGENQVDNNAFRLRTDVVSIQTAAGDERDAEAFKIAARNFVDAGIQEGLGGKTEPAGRTVVIIPIPRMSPIWAKLTARTFGISLMRLISRRSAPACILEYRRPRDRS
jgi:hypothetical protein